MKYLNKVGEFKFDRYNAFIINFCSLAVFLTGVSYTLILYTRNYRRLPLSAFNLNNLIISFIVIIIVALIHELTHGLVYSLFGAKLKFGYKFMSLYTIDVSGKLYNMVQSGFIFFSPLMFISLILVLLIYLMPNMFYFILYGLLFNISGSIGDILLFMFILYKGTHCKIKDEDNGFGIYEIPE